MGQAPLLRVHAITDISWDDASRARYAQVAEQGMVFDNPQSLVGAALISGEPLISNQPASDPRSGGLPHGHPPLTAFMGLPIHAAGQLVAMVGVANRAGGYSSADVHFLQPLLNSVGQLEMARRADIERREVEARWRSLTQLSSDWYWEQDAEFRFVRFEGNAHSSGLPNPNHLGLTRWELPDAIVSDTQWRVHRAQLQAHEVFHDFEMQRLDADGAPIWVSISGEPIFDGEGNFTGYRGLARNITERKRAEAEIQRLAFFDELTGLPNRRLLLERLERVAAACERGACHGALLFLDLDNFKNVNDTLGHECGDHLLLQAGQRVVRSGQFLIDSEASLRGLEARLNPGSEPATPVPQSHRTDAVIDALDGDTVTLTHPPVPSLKWPEMTMDFKLPPRERQPRELGVGERVQIEFRMQDGDVPQITGIQRVAPGAPR